MTRDANREMLPPGAVGHRVLRCVEASAWLPQALAAVAAVAAASLPTPRQGMGLVEHRRRTRVCRRHGWFILALAGLLPTGRLRPGPTANIPTAMPHGLREAKPTCNVTQGPVGAGPAGAVFAVTQAPRRSRCHRRSPIRRNRRRPARPPRAMAVRVGAALWL